MPVRLVALDVDGTLVDTRTLEIAAADAAAVRRCVERGARVVLASARWPSSVRYFQRTLGIGGPLLCHNGALVLDEDGHELLRLPIDPERAARIVRAAVARDLYPTIIVDDALYARPRPDQVPGRIDVSRGAHELWLELVEDLVAVVSRGPMDIGVFGPGVAGLLADVAGEPVAAFRYYRDGELRGAIFHHPRASKGNALRFLCEELDVPLVDVLAVGDSEADVSMLAVAGVAVAPANAPEEVRRAAHWIAPAQHEGAVAAALARFVLGEKEAARPGEGAA